MPYGDYNWIANKLKTVYRNIKAIKNPKNSEEESFVFIRKTAFDGHRAIIELLSKVDEMEARNKRLEEARENANAACAKWEGLYRAKLGKESGWISVKDRLPELPDFDHCDRMVITCDWKGHVAPMYWERRTIRGKSIERWRYHFDRIYDGFGITHWMPLPEPPKEE